MTLIKISEDGLMGCELIPTMHCTQEIMVCSKTSYPLTEPGDPNSEVDAELVWQYKSELNEWVNVPSVRYDEFSFYELYRDDSEYYNIDTHQAWQVSKPKLEAPSTAEVTEHPLAEIAAYIFKNKYNLLPVERSEGFKEGYSNGFYDGSNHILTSKGIVDREAVQKLIDGEITFYKDASRGAEYWEDRNQNDLIVDALTDLLAKIKSLK